MLPTRTEIRGERARRSFYEFVKLMWPVLEPASELVDGIHVRLICARLQAITEGRVRRLIITVPPRHGKSNLVSILWPAWVWATDPHTRWLFVSFAQPLADRHSSSCRRVIESPEYQELFGTGFRLACDANQKSRFENDRRGARLATSIGGAATGEGGDVIVVDDPLKIEEADSQAARNAVIEFFDRTLSTRLNHPATGAIVVVCQRLHQRDLVGHLLSNGTYEHLCLPAEYDPRHPYLSWLDPRREAGELLWPERLQRIQLEELKLQLGSHGTASQLQQLPAAPGGEIFARDKWRWYEPSSIPDCEEVIVSVDLAYTGTEHSDYTVAQVWGAKAADKYLLYQHRHKLAFTQQIEMIKGIGLRARQYQRHGLPPGIYVERAANADALISTLGREIPGLNAVKPHGDKRTRALAISPQVEAGNIYLPGAANSRGTDYDPARTPHWVQQFVDEAASFPHGAHDDQVDAFAQAVSQLSRVGPRLRALG